MHSVSRVTTEHYAKGRIALLGDAAYGNTLGGFGARLAVVGAYVPAGELYRANGDYKTAYAQYREKFHRYAKVSRKINAGRWLAPSTRFGLYAHNRMLSIAVIAKRLITLMDHFATDIELDDCDIFSAEPA